MPNLERVIRRYLSKNGLASTFELVESISLETGVSKEKVQRRINKMIFQEKLNVNGGKVSNRHGQSGKEEMVDEAFEYGPIRLTRKGKVIKLESKWKKGEYQAFLSRVKHGLPGLRGELERKIAKFEQVIIQNYDPLDVLSYVASRKVLVDPDVFSESSFEVKQWFSEFTQNIVLKNPLDKYKTSSERLTVPSIEKELNQRFEEFVACTQSEILTREGLSEVEKDVLHTVVIWRILVRGRAYPQHVKVIATELFDRIGLERFSGYTVLQYFETIEEINRQ